MAKPITKLTEDLEKKLVKGKKELAKTIVKTLTEEGPWWTGTFGENWVVSKSPVQPTRKRIPETSFNEIPKAQGRKVKTNARVPTSPLQQDLYVGNRAKYAGFAINAPGQTLPNRIGDLVTYAEHGREHRLTARRGPNWYNIYTKGNFIKLDIAKAFKKVGFK